MRMAVLMDELATLNAEAEGLICDCDTEEPIEVFYAIKELRPVLCAMIALIKRYGGSADDARE